MIFSSHCIDAINRSPSPCPLLCTNGFFSQDLAIYPVGYTSYTETLKLTSQTHTHTHTHGQLFTSLFRDKLSLQGAHISTRAMATKKGTISCASTWHRTMAMTYHIALHNGDDDNKTMAVTTTLLPTSPSFVSYHIA